MLTSNRDWRWGLAAGFRAGARNGTVLLSGPDSLGHAAKDFLHRHEPSIATLLAMGGTDVLSAGVDADIDWQPPASGSIAGVVTAEGTGAPLEGVRVIAYGLTKGARGYTLYRAHETTTATDGSFEIGHLEPGTYTLSFAVAPGRPQPEGRGLYKVDGLISVEASPAPPARGDRALPFP